MRHPGTGDEIETTVTPGRSLTYDAPARLRLRVEDHQGTANACYRFDLGLIDGSHHTFDVRFTK